VIVDAIQVQQVVFNLVRNAIEAMAEAPGRKRRVRVATALAANGRVTVEVSDTGPGCSAEVLARILEPFFTTKPGGMGVGLAISKTIVEAHGGT
jgi:signal transduction histidine kinase